MFRPCKFDPLWEEYGQEYYNVTRGMPGFEDYYDTVQAFYWNSMCVPTIASYAILSTFMAMVVLATGMNLLRMEGYHVYHQIKRTRLAKMFSKHVSSKPLIGKRHAQLFGPKFLTIKLPLRGQTIVLIGLFLANLIPIVSSYKLFTRNNLYWSDKFVQLGRYLADRAGILATAQIPPLILMSGRNNPVIWLTGMSFEACMLYHRWIARLVFGQVLIHATGYSIIAVREGGVEEYYSYFVDPYFRYGCAATVAFGFLLFLSLRYLRQRSYEIFNAIHVVMAIVALIGVHYHIHLLADEESGRLRDFDDWIYASIFFFAFDKFIQSVRIIIFNVGKKQNGGIGVQLSSVEVEQIFSGQKSTILKLKVQMVGWVAKRKQYLGNHSSRHAQLWIPRVQPFSSHPFTVADVQDDCAYFYVKTFKGITHRLHQNLIRSQTQKVHQTALLEGFYGEQCPVEKFDRSLLIAGGIGITHCLPLFIKAVKAGKDAELFWIIPESGMILVLVDFLQRQNDLSSSCNEGREGGKGFTKIVIHITNSCQDEDMSEEEMKVSNDGDADEKEGIFQTLLQKEADRVGLKISIQDEDGRPDVRKLIEANQPTALFTCGPAGMCDEIRSAKGDIELFEEVFEW